MLRTILLSAALITASASSALADSFFFGFGSDRPRPVYVQPAPVVQYWSPGPSYYASAPVYYDQPRYYRHRHYRPVVIEQHYGHGHHDHYDDRGHGGRGRR